MMKRAVRCMIIIGLLFTHVGGGALAYELTTTMEFPDFSSIQLALAQQPEELDFDGAGFQVLSIQKIDRVPAPVVAEAAPVVKEPQVAVATMQAKPDPAQIVAPELKAPSIGAVASLDSDGLAQRFLREASRLDCGINCVKQAESTVINVDESKDPAVELAREMVAVQDPVVALNNEPSLAPSNRHMRKSRVLPVETAVSETKTPFAAPIPAMATYQQSQIQIPQQINTVQQMPMPIISPQQPVVYQQPMSIPQPVMYQQPYQQPMVYQQQAQLAAALQMQAQAAAMHNQAQMLMMQAQQPVMYQQPMPSYAMLPVVHTPQQYHSEYVSNYSSSSSPTHNFSGWEQESSPVQTADVPSQLMAQLDRVRQVGIYGMQRLLWLMDIEFEIIEQLLAGAGSQIIEQVVLNRNQALRESLPVVAQAYKTIIDLASSGSAHNTDYYAQVVRKGKKNAHLVKQNKSRREFLLSMMDVLEHYYVMIQNMQNAFGTTKR